MSISRRLMGRRVLRHLNEVGPDTVRGIGKALGTANNLVADAVADLERAGKVRVVGAVVYPG